MLTSRLLPFLIALLMRLLGLTLRWRVEDHCGFTSGKTCPLPGGQTFPHPAIVLFWHNRILTIPGFYNRFSKRHGSCLTSPSKDGALLAGVMARFGIGSVRGSSSRRGTAAILGLVEVLKGGGDVGISPDGPRGPLYHLHPGAVKLAQLTGQPLLPMHVGYSRYWELKSWDKFRIPKPFAKVLFVLDPLERVRLPEGETADALEAERARIEELLQTRAREVDAQARQ